MNSPAPRPKLLKTANAEYVPSEWTGTNDSGVDPLGDRVLVLSDVAADTTSGGVALPEVITDRHTMAAEAGVLVARGDGAFKWNHDRQTPYEGRTPQPGERVCIEKYAGQIIKGDDGKMYRLMESACIGAIITEEKE